VNVLIFGRRQLGKSTFAMHLAQQRDGWGIAVFDPNRQFDAFAADAYDPDTFEDLLDAASGHPAIVRYVPVNDVQNEFEAVAELMWQREHFVFIVDEASQLQTAVKPNRWIDRFVRLQQPEEGDFIQTMHRPRDAAMICRSLANHWYIFRTTDASDLAAIGERCGETVARQAESLPPGQVIFWNDDLATVQLFEDARSWYVPIHKGREEKSWNLNSSRRAAGVPAVALP
jgi:hypothetical protein